MRSQHCGYGCPGAKAPGGDPTEVDPNVTTFAWNASRMSDLINLAPTNDTDVVLTLFWLSLLVFVTMMTSQRALSPTWYKIRKQNTEYLTDTIVTTRIAKDAVDAGILVNNGLTSISRAPRDAAFCKPLCKFSGSLPLILCICMIFTCHRYDFYQWIMRLWVNVARQMRRHLSVATFNVIDVSGRVKASGWH